MHPRECAISIWCGVSRTGPDFPGFPLVCMAKWRSILSMDDIPEFSELHLPIELWEAIFDDLDGE